MAQGRREGRGHSGEGAGSELHAQGSKRRKSALYTLDIIPPNMYTWPTLSQQICDKMRGWYSSPFSSGTSSMRRAVLSILPPWRGEIFDESGVGNAASSATTHQRSWISLSCLILEQLLSPPAQRLVLI